MELHMLLLLSHSHIYVIIKGLLSINYELGTTSSDQATK